MKTLSASDKKHLRSIGHKLNPVVMIGDRGYSEAVDLEVERALNDHELIKVKINVGEPAERKELITEMCEARQATLVQAIGKIALIYRAAAKPNPKLSNLQRPR